MEELMWKLLAMILTVVALVLISSIAYITVKTLLICFKNRSRKKHKLKFKWKHKLWHIRKVKYIKYVDICKWFIIDILRGKDNLKLYGIWAFTGYYGQGKTMGCIQFAKRLQAQYPDRDIKIYSNINIVGQEKRINEWEELLDLPPNSIFIYDESQADFSCNNRDFPDDLLRKITQCRKRQFAMFMTSPVFTRMNINIRESVNYVIRCKNVLNIDRYFKYEFFRTENFEQYKENPLKLRMHREYTLDFVCTDDCYRAYNTKEEVETIKKEEVKTKKDIVYLDTELKKFRNTILKEVEEKVSKIY